MRLKICVEVKGELEEVALLFFEPFCFDLHTVSPKQIIEYKESWKAVVLPNGEKLKMKLEYGEGYSFSVLAVKQRENDVFSFVASEIVSLLFLTMSGCSVHVEQV